MQGHVTVQAETKALARGLVLEQKSTRSDLRCLIVVLIAQAHVARDFEINDGRAEVQLAGRGIRDEFLGQFGANIFGLLVVEDTLLDQQVDEGATVLGDGRGAAHEGGEQGGQFGFQVEHGGRWIAWMMQVPGRMPGRTVTIGG